MTGSPIHPELRRLATVLPRGATGRSLRVMRRVDGLLPRLQAAIERVRPPQHTAPEVVRVGGASVRVHRPPAGTPTPWPALVWIHGGGYVIGTAQQEDDICRRFARELGALVVAVDYRLAPEHPHPTPVGDCHDALVWTAERDDVDPRRVAIGGASAGGGLAASLALRARERGEVTPVLQVLTYPMLDDRTVLRSDLDESGLRLWNSRANRYGWTSYLGRAPGSAGVDPVAAPARHTELAGLPPAWIGVGTLDLFHDEDVAYAERLRAAGVACELLVVDGAYHAFDYLAPRTDVGRTFRQAQIDALRAAFTA